MCRADERFGGNEPRSGLRGKGRMRGGMWGASVGGGATRAASGVSGPEARRLGTDGSFNQKR